MSHKYTIMYNCINVSVSIKWTFNWDRKLPLHWGRCCTQRYIINWSPHPKYGNARDPSIHHIRYATSKCNPLNVIHSNVTTSWWWTELDSPTGWRTQLLVWWGRDPLQGSVIDTVDVDAYVRERGLSLLRIRPFSFAETSWLKWPED